jgi:two-component system, OmpR family, KDP operon response regulator KdpE
VDAGADHRALGHRRGGREGARARGRRLLTHRALLVEVWGPAWADDTPTLRTHIANLRRKIERADPPRRYIHTDPGVGYRFAS